jgi:hypothetical protein
VNEPSEVRLVRSVHERLNDGPVALNRVDGLLGGIFDGLGSLSGGSVLVELGREDGGKGVDGRLDQRPQSAEVLLEDAQEKKGETNLVPRVLSINGDPDTVLTSGTHDRPHVVPEKSKLLEVLSADSVLDLREVVAGSRVGVEEGELKVGRRLSKGKANG